MNRPTRLNLILAFSILSLLATQTGFAQETIVSGKVMDAGTGDPIPFANLLFKGTSVGTTTDFDGNFQIKTKTPSDSLIASYVGYKMRTKFVKKGITQVINFQLEEEATRLKEAVVLAGENPAFPILRNVVDHKKEHDKRRLAAYEYETYTKIEIDIDNMSEKFRQRSIMKKITQVMDSIDRIAGEDGKPILPMFISENVSKLYYRDNPQLKTERIKNSKITGVGIEDGDAITQFVGSSFQEYNFYQNWLNIVSKDFISPIADGWKLYYEYDLIDSVYIGNHYCYRLDFFPKSPQDLAFTGTIWITKGEYALKQIEVTVNGKQANLNFIEKIKIQQELEPTGDGPWLPVKNRVLIDVGEFSDKMPGLLAKFYTSNKNFVTNKVRDPSFYIQSIVVHEEAYLHKEEKFWDSLRHEPLSETEKSVYAMIDTLKNLPVVKTYTDIIMTIVNGYYEVGKIEVGPYLSIFSVNNIEGARFQLGFRTHERFSRKWILGTQVGYGFKDEKFKYSFNVQRIISRKRWTTFSARTRSDVARIGVDDEALADNYTFLAAQRFGNFRRGYYFKESRVNWQREFFKGFSQRFAVRYNTFTPTFNFGYYRNPDDPASVAETFQTAELIVETRYAKDELFIQGQNNRYSLGTTRWPVLTLRYIHGFSDVLSSDFDYNKVKFSVSQPIKYGVLGNAQLELATEYIFDALPYPLLSYHLGNETPIWTPVTFNLMNFGEFVSDSYASLQYRHNFEGFLLNRIPLMRRLKWRLVGGANVLYGGLSKKNRDLLIDGDVLPDGRKTLPVGSLERGKPYVEVNYGVENIFKFFRVDFVHRLSYLDYDPNVKTRKFGILFGVQINL